MIQPIVIGNVGMASAGKAKDKEGKSSSGFDALLQLTVETEKGKEINVELLGLLTQSMAVNQMVQPSTIINSPSELTENIDNQAEISITVPSQTGKELILQQESLHNQLQDELSLLQQSDNKVDNNLESSDPRLQTDLPEEAPMDSILKKLVNPILSGSDSGIELKQKDQENSSKTGGSVVTSHTQSLENPLLNLSNNHLHQQQSVDSLSKPVINTPIRAEQFDQDLVKFVESAIKVHDIGDGIEANFRLSPEHLGKVDVKVSIVDGLVTADFLASTPTGKDLLESHVHNLRFALEAQGFQVDKINITQQNISSFMGSSFSQKGESNGRHTQQDAKKRNVQSIHNQEKEYRDFGFDSESQINTTA